MPLPDTFGATGYLRTESGQLGRKRFGDMMLHLQIRLNRG